MTLPPAPDEWMAALARVPLLYQPGQAWLYNTCCSDLQGVLIGRVKGQSLPDFLAERVFEPLGMVDTGFEVPAAKRERFTSYYRTGPQGGLTLVDGPEGRWSAVPAFPSGAGGLVSTIDDWLAFARLLLADGEGRSGPLLTRDSVRQMTSDHLTDTQREAGALFLEGHGWGFGGSVDISAADPWNVPGRYGWAGGTGTAAYVVPSTVDPAHPGRARRPGTASPAAGLLRARRRRLTRRSRLDRANRDAQPLGRSLAQAAVLGGHLG